MKRKSEEYKFLAALQGIDLDKALKESGGKESKVETKKKDEFLFKSPEAYSHMSQEEKEAETQKIMNKIKGFLGAASVPIGVDHG